MLRWMVRGGILAAMLALGGCIGGIGTGALLAAGSTSTIILEDKLPSDLIASAVTGEDCNYIRKLDDKGPLCRPYRREVIERPLYCYRTLGQIECFEERDPYGIGQRTVN